MRPYVIAVRVPAVATNIVGETIRRANPWNVIERVRHRSKRRLQARKGAVIRGRRGIDGGNALGNQPLDSGVSGQVEPRHEPSIPVHGIAGPIG